MIKTTNNKATLIITERFDTTADTVVCALKAHDIDVFRFDVSEFPQELELEVSYDRDGLLGRLTTRERSVALADVVSIYVRRPSHFAFRPELSQPETTVCRNEARYGFGGALMSLDAVWMNHPSREVQAAYKPRQLATAARCGLEVPSTLVTNDPLAAKEFVRSRRQGAIAKPLAIAHIPESNTLKAVFTHRVTANDESAYEGVRATAHLFQEWVPKRHEVRLNVVGTDMFATAIHAMSEQAHLDWRSDYDSLEYEAVDVPASVAAAVLKYQQSFDLNFGAFDFVVTPDGKWVFLECNSNGQWGWIAEIMGQPIHESIARFLAC